MAINDSTNNLSQEPQDSEASLEPDPQVIPGNTEFGNRYTLAYKLQVLQESDACTKPGEMGLYLRRMGLTHATLTCFRRQRAAGTLQVPVTPPATAPRNRTKTSPIDPEATKRLMEAERENRKLRRQLDQAQLIIEIQKKVSQLLEISLEEPSSPNGIKSLS